MELEASRDLTRTWLHVDMDAFYAAVETLGNPALKGRPLAVGSLSMICTANYEVCNLSICSFYCFSINICRVCVSALYFVICLHIFVVSSLLLMLLIIAFTKLQMACKIYLQSQAIFVLGFY